AFGPTVEVRVVAFLGWLAAHQAVVVAPLGEQQAVVDRGALPGYVDARAIFRDDQNVVQADVAELTGQVDGGPWSRQAKRVAEIQLGRGWRPAICEQDRGRAVTACRPSRVGDSPDIVFQRRPVGRAWSSVQRNHW